MEVGEERMDPLVITKTVCKLYSVQCSVSLLQESNDHSHILSKNFSD